jgi:endonuclease/exonuclease/phosphatase family metal-dependent hydrolase
MRDAAVRMAAAGRAARETARERRATRAAERQELRKAHLALVRAPSQPMDTPVMSSEITVATYNVHRWTGLNGRKAPDPARAGFVISELDADVIALQEVLRPAVSDRDEDGHDAADDPLVDLSEALGMHLVFAVTREHRRGQLGNAILSRFPVSATSVVDISFSRIERRGALTAQFNGETGNLAVVATHLSLVDRTRHRQVQSLLDHPQLNAGPVVLMGDMNAWRRCPATRELDESLRAHHNLDWPPSFPSAAPVLALDRIYARGAHVVEVFAHDSPAARRASDHLPVVARVEFEES